MIQIALVMFLFHVITGGHRYPEVLFNLHFLLFSKTSVLREIHVLMFISSAMLISKIQNEAFV